MRPFLLNMMPVLLLFGTAVGIFLALVLLGIKRGNRTANRILAGILVFFSIDLVEGFLSVTYGLTKILCLIAVTWPLVFLYGPLVYFYIKALTGSLQHASRWKLFAHLIPTALLYLYLLPFYLADPEVKTHAWFVQNGSLRNDIHAIDPILYVIIFQIAGYLILSLRLLAFHAKTIRQNFYHRNHQPRVAQEPYHRLHRFIGRLYFFCRLFSILGDIQTGGILQPLH